MEKYGYDEEDFEENFRRRDLMIQRRSEEE